MGISFRSCILIEEQEYNYKLKQDDWEYTLPTREDKWHVEVGNSVGPVEVMHPYADLDGTIENRINSRRVPFIQRFNIPRKNRISSLDNKELLALTLYN